MTEQIKTKRVKRQLSLLEQYKAIFDSEAGRQVLYDLMKESGFAAVSHVPLDTASTAFNDGRRSLFLHVLKRLNSSTEDLIKLIQQGEENERSAFSDSAE